ncbi:mucin-15 [Anolis carolinensis]|uniref:Mucin 15, cell surface associated n=1 Tax=Anolis carolinensis TaxID=28377 RepID=H9G9B3_ANOCA|nr:PREDICTED: mucin-15 [Anolis carolinensis]|eukprot:XP_008114284.1 PREDICTED: mucin-15 [Anolis carolinensis]
MLVSKRLILFLMMASFQWTRNNCLGVNHSTLSIHSLNSTTMNSSTFIATSGITPSITLTSPTATTENITKNTGMQNNTQSNGINSTSMHKLNFTKGVNHSSVSINRTPPPSDVPTTSNYLSTILPKSVEATTHATSTETRSNTTASYNGNFTSMVSSNKTLVHYITVHPTNNPLNTSSTLLTTKSTSTTTDLWLTAQTTRWQSNFTDSSAEAREHQKENHTHGAVVFGAIVGGMLGSALIGLAGYFMCAKRKSESFGHQRLYDDTRNDPVLRLDSTPEPFDATLGDLSYYNPTTANETAAQNSKETSYDTIPMDDLTSPHPRA